LKTVDFNKRQLARIMQWFSVLIGVILLGLYAGLVWRERRPENVRVGWGNPGQAYRSALVWFAVAAVIFFLYLNDSQYWGMAIALIPASFGVMFLRASSHGELSEAQKDSVRRRVARQWWVGPAIVASFLVFIWPIVLFAPRWILGVYLTLFLCAFSARIIWPNRIPPEPGA
jgi:hypothetical protein